jgi:hypothetical protein
LHRSSIIFLLFLAALFGVGVYTGVAVASIPKLEAFKLLNILGLTYDLLGLIVLSEFVLESERWKAFMVHWVAGTLLWAQSVIPIGAAFGAEFLSTGPSAARAAAFFFALFAYSLVPLSALDEVVFNPRRFGVGEKTERTKRFGLLLLLSGVLIQLVAAFLDLYA